MSEFSLNIFPFMDKTIFRFGSWLYDRFQV
jgi:hypothetical protein